MPNSVTLVAEQCSLPDCLSVNTLREIPSFARYNMDSESLDEGNGQNTSEASKTVSNDVLTDWNAELCREKETVVSVQTRVAGNSACLIRKPESKGTKDPSSSQLREAGQTVKPSKKGDNGKAATGTSKRDVGEKLPGKKSAPKDGSERPSTSAKHIGHYYPTWKRRSVNPNGCQHCGNFERFFCQLMEEYERRI